MSSRDRSGLLVDPARLCIALGPLAAYLLVAGVVNLSRGPLVTTGTRDLLALAVGRRGAAGRGAAARDRVARPPGGVAGGAQAIWFWHGDDRGRDVRGNGVSMAQQSPSRHPWLARYAGSELTRWTPAAPQRPECLMG